MKIIYTQPRLCTIVVPIFASTSVWLLRNIKYGTSFLFRSVGWGPPQYLPINCCLLTSTISQTSYFNQFRREMESSSCSHALLTALIFLFHFLMTNVMGSSLATSPILPSKTINTNNIDYIKKSCNTTMYPSLCYKSLSKYADKIQSNPKVLATIALNITLSSSQSTLSSMKNPPRVHVLNPRETSAMKDCLEVLSDSTGLLGNSMEKMDQIDLVPEFEFDMSDVQTWVSAALTDDTTCMDGFDGDGVHENVKAMVQRRVSVVSQLTSISSTFINNYAKIG